MNLRNFFLLSVLAVFLTSCEYPLDEEVFKDIPKPADQAPLTVTLDPDAESSEFYEHQTFRYEVNTFDKRFVKVVFSYLGNETVRTESSGFFGFSPPPDFKGSVPVTATVFFGSGTGSIADKLEAEGYIAAKTWNMRVDTRPIGNLNLQHEITPEGYLRLFWNRYPRNNFKEYTLTSLNEILTFPDQEQTSYVDSSYVGNGSNYYLSVTSTIGQTVTSSWLDLAPEVPVMKYEVSPGSIRLYWERSRYARANYLIEYEDKLIRLPSHITEYNLETDLNSDYWVRFYVLPETAADDDRYKYHLQSESVKYGTSLNISTSQMEYNAVSNVLYAIAYMNSIVGFDINTLEMIHRKTIPDMYGGLLSTSRTNTKVILWNANDLVLYGNPEMTDPVARKFTSPSENLRVQLLGNDIAALQEYDNYYLFDMKSGNVAAKLFADPTPLYSVSLTTSDNTLYTLYQNGSDAVVYRRDGSGFSELHRLAFPVTTLGFNTKNEEQFFSVAKYSNRAELRGVAANNLIRSLELPAEDMKLMNVDPETGNVLFHGNGFIAVTDNALTRVIHMNRIDRQWPTSRLYANKLILDKYLVFDLSKELP